MNLDNKEIKIINFIEDFGCVKVSQLETLFDLDKITLKNILKYHFINKKEDTIIFKNRSIDKKMIAALDVLCRYKGRYKYFKKDFKPIYISFLSNKDEVYSIIVSEKKDEEGIVKMLNKNQNLNADKIIILFEDELSIGKLIAKKKYLYCLYPDIKIIK